jgi:hypothetical protein
MKPEEIYHTLKEVAEKIDIKVVEKNLLLPGLRAKSGLCIVEGRRLFIMDKNKKLKDKMDTLAACIGAMGGEALDRLFIVPVVRDLILKARQKLSKRISKKEGPVSTYTFDEGGEED